MNLKFCNFLLLVLLFPGSFAFFWGFCLLEKVEEARDVYIGVCLSVCLLLQFQKNPFPGFIISESSVCLFFLSSSSSSSSSVREKKSFTTTTKNLWVLWFLGGSLCCWPSQAQTDSETPKSL